MTDPSDLAATLRRFLANPKAKVGSVPVAVLPHDFVAEVASALERGAAVERCYHEAANRFDRLMTVLMESIERGDDQSAQLELIAEAGDAYADWDDESRALFYRARPVAARAKADLERGAAAEAALVIWRAYESWTYADLQEAGAALADALAAYDALKETSDGCE